MCMGLGSSAGSSPASPQLQADPTRTCTPAASATHLSQQVLQLLRSVQHLARDERQEPGVKKPQTACLRSSKVLASLTSRAASLHSQPHLNESRVSSRTERTREASREFIVLPPRALGCVRCVPKACLKINPHRISKLGKQCSSKSNGPHYLHSTYAQAGFCHVTLLDFLVFVPHIINPFLLN